MSFLKEFGRKIYNCFRVSINILSIIPASFNINASSIRVHLKLFLAHFTLHSTINYILQHGESIILYKKEQPLEFYLITAAVVHILFKNIQSVRGFLYTQANWIAVAILPSLIFLECKTNPYDDVGTSLISIMATLHILASFVPFTDDFRKDIGFQMCSASIGFLVSSLPMGCIMLFSGLYIDELQYLYYTPYFCRAKGWFEIFPLYLYSVIMLSAIFTINIQINSS